MHQSPLQLILNAKEKWRTVASFDRKQTIHTSAIEPCAVGRTCGGVLRALQSGHRVWVATA
eukprot:SAG31_NODE_1796_length_7245_cov_57.374195_3_plen_61_part_00